MKKTVSLPVILAVLCVIGGFLWLHNGHSAPHAQVRHVLFYQDSMHPWMKSDQPGKCTICDMDLTPIYEGEHSVGLGNNLVVLSSNNITVLNVQTEEVKRQDVRRILRVAGLIDANEAKRSIVSAPAAGRVEETAVDYAGLEVRKGERLLTFYSPGLTQQKYRYMARAARSTEQRDPTGGLAVEKGDADPYYTDLIAPLAGTVIERNVTRGQYVAEGERLFVIADAAVLWFRFDVYEQQLPWLRPGQKVMVSLPSIPGEVYEAVISFIDPMLDQATRSVKVRADLCNPVIERDGIKQRRFKFGMYAEGVVRAEVTNVLTVSRSAVLYPGKSAHVFIDKGGGAYERRAIKLGRQGDESCEVRAGLEEGDQVVTSGNVLLDAQAQFNQNSSVESDDADSANLTPVMVVQLPVASPLQPAMNTSGTGDTAPIAAAQVTGVATQRVTHAQNVKVATSKYARNRSVPKQAPAGDPSAKRMLENPMFVRMAELRNAELAEAHTAEAAQSKARMHLFAEAANDELTTNSGDARKHFLPDGTTAAMQAEQIHKKDATTNAQQGRE